MDRAGTNARLIVFLHEGLCSISMWGDWPQRLCNAIGRRGWAYARDGYGRSTRPDVSTAADHVQQGDSARQRVFSVNCRY